MVREAVDFVFDLDGQLARRREDQDAALRGGGRAVDVGPRRRQQPLQRRHDERGRLARARFGARDDVAAGERERDHRGLHGARMAEPEIADAFEQPRIEVERGERDRRRVARRRFERRRVRGRGPMSVGLRRRRERPPPPARGRSPRPCAHRLCWNSNVFWLAGAEGDDAPDGIVRRDADGHAIARNHLDAEAAHSAAELGQHLVAGVALHAVQPAAVHRHHGALHVNEIVLAQSASDPFLSNNYCATSGRT